MKPGHENVKSRRGKSGLRKKAEMVLLVLLCGWVAGGTLHGLLGETGTQFDTPVPDSLIAEVVERLPAHRYYLVFDVGSCGTPFQTTINYLYNREFAVDVAVLTSNSSLKRLRGLRLESGSDGLRLESGSGGLHGEARLSIHGGHDDLVAMVTQYANALLVERTESGQLLVYPFDRPSMSEYIAVLDDVLGTSLQRHRGEVKDSNAGAERTILL